MRFISLPLLFVFLITFVSAVPAPDKYIHHYEPGCPRLRSKACLLIDWCQYHRERGDLFTTPNGELKSRNAPETENSDFNFTDELSPSSLATRELDINWKRTNIATSIQCGSLSCVTNREASERFTSIVAGTLYDLIVDYPYSGATGGTVGVFAQSVIAGAFQVVCLGRAQTGYGGTRFTFTGRAEALFYQVVFLGDNPATAAINYFITPHT